ncbi:MAG: glycosyltransferase family 4 protein [Dehalococcoidia bacterium]
MPDIRRVLLIQPLEGARWRSINAYALSLEQMLTSAGVEVDIASAPWFNPPSMVRGAARRWTHQPELRAATAGEYDVVHLTDHALAHHARRFEQHTAVVVTCHDLMPFTTPGYYETGREARLKRAFLKRPIGRLSETHTVAVSEYTRRQMVEFLGVEEASITVVPNSVRGVFAPRERAEAEHALGEFGIELPASLRVLSVGNDRAYKNLPALLGALARPALAHASLIRVGAPIAGRARAEAERLGLIRRITDLGHISDETLALVYSACDVLAQPSLAEGFGLPVIEAMASGLPVAASDGGALPEVTAGAAVIVPLDAADFAGAFAAGLLQAVAGRDELSRLGSARAEAFKPAQVLPRLLDAYARAIESGKR